MPFHRYVVFPSLALAAVAGLASALPSVASQLFPAPTDAQRSDTPTVLLVKVTRADSLQSTDEARHRQDVRPAFAAAAPNLVNITDGSSVPAGPRSVRVVIRNVTAGDNGVT